MTEEEPQQTPEQSILIAIGVVILVIGVLIGLAWVLFN
jgi:hypothetical protein